MGLKSLPPKNVLPVTSGEKCPGPLAPCLSPCGPAFCALSLIHFLFFPPLPPQDAFVELYGPSMRPLFDFSWLSLKALLSLALVGACITLGAYLGHK